MHNYGRIIGVEQSAADTTICQVVEYDIDTNHTSSIAYGCRVQGGNHSGGLMKIYAIIN